jgi:5-hydroxyisourate hydrolase-like protein (transthyretin family)
MNRTRQAVAVSLTLVATCICQPGLLAQSQAVSQTGNRVISGVLLNERTGQPIDDATVTLAEANERKLFDSVQTDAEGRFSFSNLSDGKYVLRASHRGYIAGAYEQHETGSFTAIVAGDGLDTTDLRFKLEPQCALYGTISDDSGDPVFNARVSLYRVDPASGTGRMVRVNSANSDGIGFYTISRLAPGSYYLAVAGSPWYATRRQVRDAHGIPIENLPRSPLDVAYTVTYYPDVTDASSASPITVTAGDRVQVNLTLHPVPAVHIVMQVPNPGPGQGLAMPQLRQDIFGNSEFVSLAGATMRSRDPRNPNAEITVELNGVPPGQYDALFMAPNGQPSRSMTLDASTDRLNLDPSIAVALAEISGKVAMAGAGALPSNLSLFFTSQLTGERLMARLAPDGSFHLQPVHPGSYEVTASAAGSPMAVTRLSATGGTVEGRLLKVGSEPVTVTAQVAESISSVSGFAKLDRSPVSGVLLVLVPANPASGQEDSRINQSDSDGSFEFEHVIAGAYIVVAIEDGWSLDWGRREVMEHYLAKGQRVVVPAHTTEINLKDPVEVQPK